MPFESNAKSSSELKISADRLREAMIRKELSYADAAKSVGVCSKTFRKYCRNPNVMSVDLINKVAAVCGLDPFDLVEQKIV